MRVVHATGKRHHKDGRADALCGAKKVYTTTTYATCKRCIAILRKQGRAYDCVNTPESIKWKKENKRHLGTCLPGNGP